VTPESPIALVSAIAEEFAEFADLAIEREVSLAGFLFRVGTLGGCSVVAVESGIGKVHAALVATLLFQGFGCRALVFSGVAGGLDPALAIGDVVVADRLVVHDYGALVAGRIRPYQPGVPPLPGVPDDHGYALDPALAARLHRALDGIVLPVLPAPATGAAPRQPRLVFGTVLTGDSFLNCGATRERLHRDFGGLAVEMEGGALAAVAERFCRPAVVIRALSDLAGTDSHADFPAFARAAAKASAAVVRRVLGVV
jgi:adenosylhomocysteine nucleosidase